MDKKAKNKRNLKFKAQKAKNFNKTLAKTLKSTNQSMFNPKSQIQRKILTQNRIYRVKRNSQNNLSRKNKKSRRRKTKKRKKKKKRARTRNKAL